VALGSNAAAQLPASAVLSLVLTGDDIRMGESLPWLFLEMGLCVKQGE
jgi:hypothetical protein